VAEALQFVQDMNLVHGVMYPVPEENGWDICRYLYRDQKVAFCPNACWIMSENDDYGYQSGTPLLDFDMVFVPWPVGPSGNAETNAQKVTESSCYMIPVGVEDPELIFNVLYDLCNWFNGDLSIRDDEEALEWWYGVTAKDIDLQDHNFDVMYEMGQKQQFEMLNNLGFELPFREFINGDYTVAQLQETYKQQVQDAIDGLMGN